MLTLFFPPPRRVFVFSGSHHDASSLNPRRIFQDVEDVKFVINYDYPNSSEDYIHRIGRTARSTNKGTAYTFFTPGNVRQARELIRVLEEAQQAINPKLLQLVDNGRGGGGGGIWKITMFYSTVSAAFKSSQFIFLYSCGKK